MHLVKLSAAAPILHDYVLAEVYGLQPGHVILNYFAISGYRNYTLHITKQKYERKISL
jgi:hypothetical protein